LPAARRWLAATPQQWQPLPPEKVNLTGQGSYDPASGTLKIERTALAASTLSVAASGLIKSITSTPEVDLSGEVAYDLERLGQQVQSFYAKRNASGVLVLPYGLNTLVLSGKEQRQFVLKGPLFAASAPTNTAAAGRGFASAAACRRSQPRLAGRAVRRPGRRAVRFPGEAGWRHREHWPARHSR
jgi:hypothetical protein